MCSVSVGCCWVQTKKPKTETGVPKPGTGAREPYPPMENQEKPQGANPTTPTSHPVALTQQAIAQSSATGPDNPNNTTGLNIEDWLKSVLSVNEKTFYREQHSPYDVDSRGVRTPEDKR